MFPNPSKKTCEELGFQFVLKQVGSAADISLADGDGVEEAIIEANENVTVDGIMVTMKSLVPAMLFLFLFLLVHQVYYPIFGGQQVGYISFEVVTIPTYFLFT
jgi:methylenetetrahydrofolate dehydrogenase (NAD+)